MIYLVFQFNRLVSWICCSIRFNKQLPMRDICMQDLPNSCCYWQLKIRRKKKQQPTASLIKNLIGLFFFSIFFSTREKKCSKVKNMSLNELNSRNGCFKCMQFRESSERSPNGKAVIFAIPWIPIYENINGKIVYLCRLCDAHQFFFCSTRGIFCLLLLSTEVKAMIIGTEITFALTTKQSRERKNAYAWPQLYNSQCEWNICTMNIECSIDLHLGLTIRWRLINSLHRPMGRATLPVLREWNKQSTRIKGLGMWYNIE